MSLRKRITFRSFLRIYSSLKQRPFPPQCLSESTFREPGVRLGPWVCLLLSIPGDISPRRIP